jgi:hypothetical protein
VYTDMCIYNDEFSVYIGIFFGAFFSGSTF